MWHKYLSVATIFVYLANEGLSYVITAERGKCKKGLSVETGYESTLLYRLNFTRSSSCEVPTVDVSR
jgi:hypothetical protein